MVSSSGAVPGIIRGVMLSPGETLIIVSGRYGVLQLLLFQLAGTVPLNTLAKSLINEDKLIARYRSGADASQVPWFE
jgi:hypothetical protein